MSRLTRGSTGSPRALSLERSFYLAYLPHPPYLAHPTHLPHPPYLAMRSSSPSSRAALRQRMPSRSSPVTGSASIASSIKGMLPIW